MTDVDLMLRFMVQVLVVLASCRVIGYLGKRFLGQTQVVMEMIVGVCIGPSLLGAFFPAVQTWLFPAAKIAEINGVPVKHPSMGILYVIAQLGLVLYMFIVGTEFDLELLTKRAKGAVSVSMAGIILPFALGAGLSVLLVNGGHKELFGSSVGIGEGALYMGAAMCITAFPMLARILVERGIAKTEMGVLALGAGAADDATAWALLAVVLASYKHNLNYALYAIVGGVLFAVAVMTLGRKLFAQFGARITAGEEMTQTQFGFVLLFLFAGAWVTDALGIYAVFGAFIIGSAMPRGRFVEQLRTKIEPTAVGLFLPFFFVYSGLNTKLGLLNSPAMWVVCLLLCGAAMLGKFGGCALAARLDGQSWRDACAIGTLMNARGLMELIILNIGLQQGVITPTLFTILTIMAILTTLMASPIFNWLYSPKRSLGEPVFGPV